MKDPKHYSGNNPNSPDYDPNIPIGWNKWDAPVSRETDPDDDEIIPDEPEVRDDEFDTDVD